MAPRAQPAQLVVDALLQRFAPIAKRRIDTAQTQDCNYLRIPEPGYEQILDALAMVAKHTPIPLLEALLSWRERESPKGAGDLVTYQRRLTVECIFCSACIRFVGCCPPDGLTEALWLGLEEFIFDWLINADRLVSHVEYPSLVELRGLLLDLVAELLGALSVIRFSTLTDRFFVELNNRWLETGPQRVESLSLIHGMRFLRMEVTTQTALNASTSFLIRANPLSRTTPQKKKTELHHAMCSMLASILAPLAEAGPGKWPPRGVEEALSLWYESVVRLRTQLSQWMEKHSKHTLVGYPLITLLLCLGDPQFFVSAFQPYLDALYKLLKEKSYRSMALECLHRLLRFFLNVYSETQPRNVTRGFLQSITTQLLAILKKGSLTLDIQHDKVVAFCVTIAENNLDFAMNGIVLELLKLDTLGEAKVIGLRSLLAIVHATSAAEYGMQEGGVGGAGGGSLGGGGGGAVGGHRQGSGQYVLGNGSLSLDERVSSSLRGSSSGSSWSYLASSATPLPSSPRSYGSGQQQRGGGSGGSGGELGLSARGNGGVLQLEANSLGSLAPKVRQALASIIKACHTQFGQALLTSSKPQQEPQSKERQQGWLVFQWALKCVPHLIPEQWHDNKMTEIIPVYAISIEPRVRDEAVQVLFRTVQDLPQSRFAVMRGMANFILRIPDDYPGLIHTSLSRLVQLLNAWRTCVADEALRSRSAVDPASARPAVALTPPAEKEVEKYGFDPSGMDAVGLIFLCSVDVQIRRTALELLYTVRSLQTDLAALSGQVSAKAGVSTTYVIDIFEEAGEDIVQRCYWDTGRWQDLRRETEPIPADVTLVSVLEGGDKGRWACCLSDLAKHVAELCPASIQGARLEVVARLAAITPTDPTSRSSGVAGGDSDSKLDQWHIYCMFACACPPEDSATDNGVQSIKELLRLVLPTIKAGSEAQVAAASMALGHSHTDICSVMLGELSAQAEELMQEADNRPKWKAQKLRRDEVRVFVAQVYRMVAEDMRPGLLMKSQSLRHHFQRFIDERVRSISASNTDTFGDLQPIRFALASVLRSLAAPLVRSIPDRFDARARKRLFDLLSSWCDEGGGWGSDGAGDYRREVERYKSAHAMRHKDSMERVTHEKELAEQVEAIQWVSMAAMAQLLVGPCFEDSARKMSGKVIGWINGLFTGVPERTLPLTGPGTDPRTPSPHTGRMGLNSSLDLHRSLGGIKSRPRAALARTALVNLLRDNLDIFPACIEQCYSSDTAIADGYFTVLAEVYMSQEVPSCDVQRILSLILYKVVDPSRAIRDDALQMLETLSQREWSEEGESGVGRYHASVVGSLPDSYQQFQFQLSQKLAKERPELSQRLCEEIMQRQLDAVDIIAQHQVLTCMAPWMDNLDLVELGKTGWSERLLKSLYYVTWKHGNQFPDEVGELWKVIARKLKNIIPVLDFLITKGIEDCDSNATGEISGAFATYFSVAKRVSLYLARESSQQTIDHLVYELAQRMLEDSADAALPAPAPPPRSKRPSEAALEYAELLQPQVLEFSQGPVPPQVELPPHLSPILSRGSFDGQSGRTSNGSWPKRGSGGRSFSGPMAPPPQPPISSRGASSGSFLSTHVPRDSIEALPDNFLLDGSGSTPRGGSRAGPNHWLSRPDIALILLAEIAYENDEDFRGHLPLLFHVTFVSMDSSEDVVLEHCQQLLVNLLYSLAGRHLELYESGELRGDEEHKQQVVSLIKYVQSKKGSLMWEKEDMTVSHTELPSATLLTSLVLSAVEVMYFQGDLRERWGEEALKWAMECASQHMASRSHQIYRALRPAVTSDTCVSLLRCLHSCFSNPSPSVLGFVMEILLTLQVMVEVMEPEKIILYPQMFWGCVAMLHTDYVHVYTQVLELFARVIDRLSFHDQMAENVLLSNMPRSEPATSATTSAPPPGDRDALADTHMRDPMSPADKSPLSHPASAAGSNQPNAGAGNITTNNAITNSSNMNNSVGGGISGGGGGMNSIGGGGGVGNASSSNSNNNNNHHHNNGGAGGSVPSTAALFEGVQPLVLKGLMSTVSHESAIEVLSRITLLSCDRIFGNLDTRLLMHIVGLLPWLCLQLQKGGVLAVAPIATAGSLSPLVGGAMASPLQQQLQKAYGVAGNISQWCVAKGLHDLALVFSLYAEGMLNTTEDLLERVAPVICAEWFPQHTTMALNHLLRLLEKGPTEYHRVILLLLRSLLMHTRADASQSPQVYSVVSAFLDGPLSREAQTVLEAVLESWRHSDSAIGTGGGAQEEVTTPTALQAAGGGFSGSRGGSGRYGSRAGAATPGQSWGGSLGSSSEIMPSREAALRNTTIALGRVLDTYGYGKKRDHKRLVPFVSPPGVRGAEKERERGGRGGQGAGSPEGGLAMHEGAGGPSGV